MPIHEIQIKEYECVHCGYKWINRVNGKNGTIPKKCAKCKRMNWNGRGEGSDYNPILPNERSLRVKLYKYEGHLKTFMGVEGTQYSPNELCSAFLNLNPRPNMQELYKALHPLGEYDSYKYRFKHYIPDPDTERPHYPDQINLKRGYHKWIPDPKKKGYIIRNPVPFSESEYIKTVIRETILRREYMKKVIESRGQTVPKDEPLKELPYWLVSANLGLFPHKYE